MIGLYIVAALVIIIVATALLLRRKRRTVVEDCPIWVSQDTHCTALVYYREKRRTLRFGAEVGGEGGRFLWVDLPGTMYSDAGDVVSPDEYETVKRRISIGLRQLGIDHELSSTESARD